MNQSRYLTTFYRIVFIIAILIITFLATTQRIYPVAATFNDKLNHLFAFLVLALLADFSFPRSSFGYAKILPLLGYGITIEIVQYYLPNRIFSLYDIAADSFGLVAYSICLPFFKKCPVLKGRWESVE